MANFYNLKYTDAGRDLMSDALANGSKMSFVGIGVGDGELPQGGAEDGGTWPMEELIHEVKRLPLETFARDDGKKVAVLTARLSTDTLDEDLYHRELGVYAELTAGNPVLIAYANAGEKYDFVPHAGDNPAIYKELKVIFALGAATVRYDELPVDEFVTFAALNERLDELIPEIVDETVQAALAATGTVALKNTPNTFTSPGNKFAHPLGVADAVADGDSATKRQIAPLSAQALLSAVPLNGITGTGYVSTGFSVYVPDTASAGIRISGNVVDPTFDGPSIHTYLVPVPRCKNYECFFSFGFQGFGYGVKSSCAPGDTLGLSTYQARCATFFPSGVWPDHNAGDKALSRARIQGSSAQNGNVSSRIMALAMLPANTQTLVWAKIDGYAQNKVGAQWSMVCGVFALKGDGALTHLMNVVPNAPDYTGTGTYANNGNHGFCVGKYSGASADAKTAGLSADAKFWDYNVLNLTPDDFIIKQCYLWDPVPVQSIDPAGGTISFSWREQESISLEDANPSSSWLTVVIDGSTVTITAAPNDTGAARMGVANIKASINGVTYTIVINQSA